MIPDPRFHHPKLHVVLAVIASVSIAGCASIDPQKVFAKARQGVDALAKLPTLDSLLHRAPVTTNFADATTEVPFLDAALPEDAEGFPLDAVPRDAEGNYLLASGLYEVTAESYCIHAGTYGPSKGDGYIYAPLRGAKTGIVQSILRRSAEKPEIPQHEVQLLLWAIVARTQLRNMPAERQRTAVALLTPKELFDLNGGALGLIPPELFERYLAKLPVDIRKAFALEQQLRQRLTAATATYEQIEQIAVLAGLAPPGHVIRPTPRGRWSYHPNGYFVRFFPSSYQRTRFQIYVPPPIAVERDDLGRIVAIDDGVRLRVETKYATRNNASTGGIASHAFKEVRVVERNLRIDRKIPDRIVTRKNKGSAFITTDVEGSSEFTAGSSTSASRRERLAVAARQLRSIPTVPGDRAAAMANLTDYSTAVRESLGRLTTKEAWAAAALPLLGHAAESELYMTMSGRTNENGHWRTADASQAPALVAFDPTANVAVPANTSSQRLVSGGVPQGRPGERWFEQLPNCPCFWSDISFGEEITHNGRTGVWRDTADWRKSPSSLHPKAEREARWTANDGGAGQQCTYKGGRLITEGLAAGTPDLYSPGKWWVDPVEAYLHFREDVAPYKHFRWLIRWLFSVEDYSCELYMKMYPPNNGNGCDTQALSPIDPIRARDVPCFQLIQQQGASNSTK